MNLHPKPRQCLQMGELSMRGPADPRLMILAAISPISAKICRRPKRRLLIATKRPIARMVPAMLPIRAHRRALRVKHGSPRR